jgi:3-oxoacyl-[acyl-carrier-protein] synthase III
MNEKITSTIVSTGSYLPEKVVLNEHLTQFPESALSRIAEKTGVLARRHADESQCTSDLGLQAARACLDRIGFPAADVQGIVLSTSSPDRLQPATATRVQHALGAHGAFAFDINSVCSGGVYGISVADSFIKSGQYDNILLICAEMYSKILNKMDFSTHPYFGDGAGAVLLRAGHSDSGVIYSRLRTDGGGCDIVCVPAGGTMQPFAKMTNPRCAYFTMNGRSVFEFAVTKGAEVLRQLAEDAGMAVDQLDLVVTHQANINIIKGIAERVGLPIDKFVVNLDRYGNTASASVLIGLDEAISSGQVRRGNLVAVVAFGGGLSWGANLIRI